jgi:hypothetical protein
MSRACDQQPDAAGILLLGERLGHREPDGIARILERSDERRDDALSFVLVERFGGRRAHPGIAIGQAAQKQADGIRVDDLGELHHGDPAHARIIAGAARGDILEVRVERVEDGHASPQQVGDVDLDGAGRAVDLARHAVPAFVVLHVCCALGLVDRQHVERADVDADAAALVGDALVVVDDDGDAGGMIGKRHSEAPGYGYSAATGVLMRKW